MLSRDARECTPLLLSISATARTLGLKDPTIRQWLSQRKIAQVKLGGRTLIPVTEITRLIAENLRPCLETASASTADLK
jgi:excisionase family DNA binding protein